MLYMGNPCVGEVTRAMSERRLGCITTPKQGNPIPEGSFWCADNGKFGKGWPGPEAWLVWLTDTVSRYGPDRCVFAVAPDVVGNAQATLQESQPWLQPVRDLNIPVAFVAQDGCSEWGLIPWGEFDVLFLGGSDEFKLGAEGQLVTSWAVDLGVPVHMGRVNSKKRLNLALSWGCSTVDGTYLVFGPRKNLRRLVGWFNELGLENFRDWEFDELLDTSSAVPVD